MTTKKVKLGLPFTLRSVYNKTMIAIHAMQSAYTHASGGTAGPYHLHGALSDGGCACGGALLGSGSSSRCLLPLLLSGGDAEDGCLHLLLGPILLLLQWGRVRVEGGARTGYKAHLGHLRGSERRGSISEEFRLCRRCSQWK